MAALRVAELNRLFSRRYGPVLPDDDAGRGDAAIMLQHLARLSGDQRARMRSWLDLRAAWMSEAERTALLEATLAKPRLWRADRLARDLGLTAAERKELRIRTIGSIDFLKRARRIARRDRKRLDEETRRRAQGSVPRAEYEARSIARTKPWLAHGIGRTTWFNRQRSAAHLAARRARIEAWACPVGEWCTEPHDIAAECARRKAR